MAEVDALIAAALATLVILIAALALDASFMIFQAGVMAIGVMALVAASRSMRGFFQTPPRPAEGWEALMP